MSKYFTGEVDNMKIYIKLKNFVCYDFYFNAAAAKFKQHYVSKSIKSGGHSDFQRGSS